MHVIACSIGRPKHVRVMAGALEGDTFIGPEAEVMYDVIQIFINDHLVKYNN